MKLYAALRATQADLRFARRLFAVLCVVDLLLLFGGRS